MDFQQLFCRAFHHIIIAFANIKDVLTKELGYWIILLTVINVIMGSFDSGINTNGYHVMNFMLLYLIGRYLKKGRDVNTVVKSLYLHTFPILIISWTMTFSMFIVLYVWLGKNVAAIRLWGYNNPFVIMTAISFFIMFTKMDVESKTINNIAQLVFPVFLLHTGVAIQPIRNNFFHGIYVDYGYWGIISSAILLFIVCAAIAYPVEILKKRPYGKVKEYVALIMKNEPI